MDTYIPGTVITDRPTSGFPLSIGTGLAFESVFPLRQESCDPLRKPPAIVDVTKYDTCWVNLSTLFRNLVTSVHKEVFRKASIQELIQILETEMDVIENLFQVEGNGVCKPLFYYSTHTDLTSRPPVGVQLRVPHTDSQKFYASQEQKTLENMVKRNESIIVLKGPLVPQKREKAFVLTHFPYELLNYKQFERLDLLESNTGALKPRSRWSSKFYPLSGKTFNHMPFNKKLLLTFGDNVLIKPIGLPLRLSVFDTSIKRQWTPLTTLDKVKFDVELDILDPYMLAIWRGL